MAVNLTKRAIDSFKYEGREIAPGKWSRDVRWDSTTTGFGIRIYPPKKDGRSVKSFVLSFRADGKKRLMKIGRYGPMTVDQARKRADAHLVAVEDGANPLEERRKSREKRTFRELREHYIEHHAKPNKKTWKADENRLNRHIPKRWDSRMAEDIADDDIKELHDRIGREKGKPYEANRLLEILKKMYGLAAGPGWRFIPSGHPNPVKGIAKFKERKRKVWATEDEVKALAKAIQKETNVYNSSVLRVIGSVATTLNNPSFLWVTTYRS